MLDYMKVVRTYELTFSERLVLLYMLNPDYEDAGYHDHARALAMSPRTFTNAVEGLIEAGYLEKIQREGNQGQTTHNRYRPLPKALELLNLTPKRL